MIRSRFEARRRDDWNELDALVRRLEAARRPSREDALALVPLYRAACEDLSLSRHRGYGDEVVQRLNRLCMRAYHVLHRERSSRLRRVGRFLGSEFPRLVREQQGVVEAAMLLFFGPFVALMAAGALAPEWVEAALPASMREQLELSFAEDGGARGTEMDAMMFGIYVWNNVSIGFRMFAGGMLFCVGAVFFIVYNGGVLGAAFGYAILAGFADNFMAFVAGHGAPELIGIVLSGAAGLRLGLAIIAPGRRTRARALREDGRIAVQLALGSAAMIFVAAIIEGFWSASGASAMTRYVAGGVIFVLTVAWLSFAGRAPRSGSDAGRAEAL